MSRKTLVVGNWKMNKTSADAIKLVTELRSKIKAVTDVEIVVAPPFTALSSVEIALQESNILMAAQNVFFEPEGAFTGEISVAMLKDVGCKYVLIGHSERRHIFKENDEDLSKKLVNALEAELWPILCVGETAAERNQGRAMSVVEDQLRRGLSKISAGDSTSCTIAYEPVWAIGSGQTATPEQAQEMHYHIRNFLSKLFDKPTSNVVRILYGGSVKAQNAGVLLQNEDVDGLLVGGASLDADQFSEIVNRATELLA